MADNEIKVELSLVDNASDKVVDAGKKIDDSLSKTGKKIDSAKGEFHGLGNEIKTNFVNAVKGAVLAYASFQVVGKVTNLLKDARKESQEYKLAVNTLTASLGYYSQALVDNADAMEKKYMVDASEILQAQKALSFYVKEEGAINNLTPAIINLARAKTIDLTSAANMVGVALARGANNAATDEVAMAKLGIEVKKTGDILKDSANVAEQLNTKLGAQAQAVYESLDGWDKLAFKIKNVTEDFGKLIFGESKQAEEAKKVQQLEELNSQLLLLKQGRIKEITNESVRYGAHFRNMTAPQLEIEIQKNKVVIDTYKNLQATKQEESKKSFEAEQQRLRDLEKRKEAEKLAAEAQKENIRQVRDAERRAYEEWKNEQLEDARIRWEKAHPKYDASLPSGFIQEGDPNAGTIDFGAQMSSADFEAGNSALEENQKKQQDEAQRHKETMVALYSSMAQEMGDSFAAAFEKGGGGIKQAFKSILNLWLGFIQRQLVAAIFAGTASDVLKHGFGALFTASIKATALTTAFELAKQGINSFATGTTYAPGGMAMVGERGPEMLYVPRGAQIYNNTETRQVINNNTAPVTVNVLGSNGKVVETLRASLRTGSADGFVSDLKQALAAA